VRYNRKRAAKKKRSRNGCAGKKKYEVYDVAKTAARNLLTCRPSLKVTTVYLCDNCSRFHVSGREGHNWIAMFTREEVSNV